MKHERVIQLLQIEKEYTLKQTGHQQQPINKEVRQALDIAIEAVKKQGPEKPQTNYEKIKNMSVEDMVKMFMNISAVAPPWCGSVCDGNCKYCAMKWLERGAE